MTVEPSSQHENGKPAFMLEESSMERLAGIFKDFEDLRDSQDMPRKVDEAWVDSFSVVKHMRTEIFSDLYLIKMEAN